MKDMRLKLILALAAIFTFGLTLSSAGWAIEPVDFSFQGTSKLVVTNDVACGDPTPLSCESYNSHQDLDSYELNALLAITNVGDFVTDVQNNGIIVSFYHSPDCSEALAMSVLDIPVALVQHGKKGAYVFEGTVADWSPTEGGTGQSGFISVNLTLNSKTSPTEATLKIEGSARLCQGILGSTPELAKSMQLNIGSYDGDLDPDTACQPVTDYKTLDISPTIPCF